MTTYVAILLTHAQSLAPDATANTFPVIEAEPDESVFQYVDTASSRAGIAVASAKLEKGRIAIVGLGGTGAYILDLLSKTPVKEIHLFDADPFFTHNAFRSPGAASLEQLRTKPSKVAYLASQYSNIHRHIKAHEVNIELATVHELQGMDFVFVCIDKGRAKRLILAKLREFRIPFIDTGLGVHLVDGALLGMVRTTAATPEKHDHLESRITLDDDEKHNDYASNIQIADLNALNAALAVIRWKKHCGFYHDLEKEHHSLYTIDGNAMNNEDRHEA